MTKHLVLGITLRTGVNAFMTLANVQDIANTFRAAFPTGRLNWAIDRGLISTSTGENAAIRAYLKTLVETKGDQVALWLEGGFPDVATPGSNKTIAEIKTLLDTHMPNLAAAFPTQAPSATAWHINATTLKYLRDTWGQTAAFAQVWSQTGIDGFTTGSTPNCPYLPTLGNAGVPAQTDLSAIDCLVIDTISNDLWAAQTNGVLGRFTVHPIDAVELKRMQSVTNEYLDQPNPISWVTNLVELDWVYDENSTNGNIKNQSTGEMIAKKRFKDWLAWLPTAHPGLRASTVKGFGDAWRALYPNNTFDVVMQGQNYADFGQGVAWRFTKQKRYALARGNWTAAGSTVSPIKLIDVCRYSDGFGEPAAPASDWSFTNQLSMKNAATNMSNPYIHLSHREVLELMRRAPMMRGLI